MAKDISTDVHNGAWPLAQQAQTPDPTQPENYNDPMLWVVALGIIVLAIWIVRRVAHPRKLALKDVPGRPNSLHLLHPLGLVLLFYALQMAAYHLLPKPWLFLGSAAGQILVLVAALAVAQQSFRRGVKRGLGLTLRRWKTDTARGVVAFLAVLPVCIGLMALLIYLFGPHHAYHPSLVEMRKADSFWAGVLIVSATVLAPLMEEVLFRGILQTTLRKYTGSAWLGVIATSVFFALIHPILLHIPVLFVLSLVLGYNYERSGRLWPVIVLHALFNAYNTAFAYRLS
jgi:membrane protease YdiL (CAAX protease family)